MFHMPNDGPQELEDISMRETTLLVCAGAFHMASSFLMGVGTFWETAHVRGIIITYECVFNGACLLLGWSQKMPVQELVPPAVMFTVALLAATLHAFEPGIFTVDKSTKSK